MEKQVYELRPREYGELLDATFDLYKEHFLLLVSITAVVYIPMAIFQALLQISHTPGAMIAAGLVTLLMGVFLALFVSGAMTKAISDAYLGQEATFGESYRYIFRRWAPYLWTNILAGVLIMLGFMFCGIPGIVIGVYLAFASQVFVIEGRAGWEAITRSSNLVTGYWWRTFVLLLLIGIIAAVLQLAPLAAISVVFHKSALGQLLSTVWQGLANTVVAPLQAILVILMYYDIRIRKEAFDLQVLADSMAEWGAGARLTTAQTVVPPTPSPDPTAAPAESDESTAADVNVCPACGSPLVSGAAFCQQCGQAVGESES